MIDIDLKNLSKRSIIEIAITSVMVVIFIFILFNSIRTIIRNRSSKVSNSYISADAFKEIVKRDVMDAAGVKSPKEIDKYKDAMEKEDAINWGRDPFSKQNVMDHSTVAISDLKLEGILWHSEKAPHAIINGEIVSKGDKIGDATVLEIQKEKVILTDGETKYELSL